MNASGGCGPIGRAPLLAPQLEHLDQRVRAHLELLWLEARQGPLDQPPIVDGSHLVNPSRLLVTILTEQLSDPLWQRPWTTAL